MLAKFEEEITVRKKEYEKHNIGFPEGQKINLMLELCFNLLPKSIQSTFIYPFDYYKILGLEKSHDLSCKLDDYLFRDYKATKNIEADRCYVAGHSPVTFPQKLIIDFNLSNSFKRGDDIIEILRKSVNSKKKNKLFSAAIIDLIYFFNRHNRHGICFKSFDFIGELLIDMGAIESALALYYVDDNLFFDANKLSLLASKAIKENYLDCSKKLIDKLIANEPFHPSIPTIQAEIKRLEQRNHLKTTFSINFSSLNDLSGLQFENLLMDKFTALGFKVASTPTTGDFGADLIVEDKDGTRIIIQCKRFKTKVNLKAVQEVIGAIGHYAADVGIVVTNNSFLNSAIKLAESHDIELWDGDKLVSFLAGDLSFSEIFALDI